MIHEHQVRERAYFIWQSKGGEGGCAASHWAQAEAELHETLVVRHVASDASAMPSPAKALKTSRAKTAKADAPKAAAKTKKAPRATAAAAH